MCISLLSPGFAIRIVYASESVWLKKRSGYPEIEADLLIQNMSRESLSKLWCIVPQRIYNEDGSVPKDPCFADNTDELPKVKSKNPQDFELVYSPSERDNKPILQLSLPNPTNLIENITYTGTHYGKNKINPLLKERGERVVMNGGPYGVFEIELTKEIEPTESRWMRLRICPHSGPRERRGKKQMIYDYFLDQLNLHYNVAGPTKVRYEIEQHLAQMKYIVNSTKREHAAQIAKHIEDLIEILIKNGVKHPATEVTINDWRTRFFLYPMESFTAIQTDGAVRTVGAQPNFPPGGIQHTEYYEWATGIIQVKNPPVEIEQGYFNIRFATRYFPRIYLPKSLFALLSLILAIVALFLNC